MSTTVNQNVFSLSFQLQPNFPQLIAEIQQSPELVSLINQFKGTINLVGTDQSGTPLPTRLRRYRAWRIL